tara:strand:- start:196 stop:351 length:156 start_codon:yes stop_codon:yes gene_type:complete
MAKKTVILGIKISQLCDLNRDNIDLDDEGVVKGRVVYSNVCLFECPEGFAQ